MHSGAQNAAVDAERPAAPERRSLGRAAPAAALGERVAADGAEGGSDRSNLPGAGRAQAGRAEDAAKEAARWVKQRKKWIKQCGKHSAWFLREAGLWGSRRFLPTIKSSASVTDILAVVPRFPWPAAGGAEPVRTAGAGRRSAGPGRGNS